MGLNINKSGFLLLLAMAVIGTAMPQASHAQTTYDPSKVVVTDGGLKDSVGAGGSGGVTQATNTRAQSNGPGRKNMATGAKCSSGTIGGMICNVINGTSNLPGLITGLAYLIGLIFGFIGIIKLKDHVERPDPSKFWEPYKYMIAAGSFFALPYVASAARKTIIGTSDITASATSFNGSTGGSAGLDGMLIKLVGNVLSPTIWAIGWVGWVAGLIFVCIGISRLLKSEQDGPRGPTGIGTITTFLIAGALMSLNAIVAFINNTVFGASSIQTKGVLAYASSMGDAAGHAHAVISAIIGFSILLGWISIARGLFIVRGVSEGNSQASMMAAVTHLIGGGLAVNLGAVINAVQKTLGITTYGITFS